MLSPLFCFFFMRCPVDLHCFVIVLKDFILFQDACEVLLEELKLEVQAGKDSLTELTETTEATSDSVNGFILVIDGPTLEWAMQEELKSKFLELSCRCKAVICCRSTPLQKSKVVQLIRDHISVMTLAVGEATVFIELFGSFLLTG